MAIDLITTSKAFAMVRISILVARFCGRSISAAMRFSLVTTEATSATVL